KAWEGMRVVAPDTCRPFSKNRGGLILGEGAAMLVLETLEHASARGAKIYAQLAGFGMSADAHHLTSPLAEGAARAMNDALDDAGLSREQINYVNAHGTGTPANASTQTRELSAPLAVRRITEYPCALKSGRHMLEFLAPRALLALPALLPPSPAMRIAMFVSRALFASLPRLRRIGLRNLELALPNLPLAERRRLLKQSFENFGRIIADFAHFPRTTPIDLAARVETSFPQGFEDRYRAAKAAGRGVI